MKEGRSSKATQDAAFFVYRGSTLGKFLALLAFLVVLIFRPNSYDPSTYWAIALVVVLFVAALVIVIARGVRGLKVLNDSAKEDRRRIAAGLPLERQEPQSPDRPPGTAGK